MPYEALERRCLFAGTWAAGAAAPLSLGEVAGGVIGNNLYLVGEGDPATLVYNVPANTWSTAAARPFVGNHHAAEVVNGRLYLFGGLTAGSDGKVQIFDPITSSWTLGADMPFAAGSSSTALIGGQVYVAGGIVGMHTTDRLARYDPVANTWAELAPMPQGRNHTAAATDGQKFYVFGGRGPGSGDHNVTTNGFDTTQVYDPATNIWRSSLTPGETLTPLPQARGGMGKAVYLNGEFYVIGGETLTGPGATADRVYSRVDVYNATTNTWRLDAPMPTARHGIFPLLAGGKIVVAAGGVRWGGSHSTVNEIFTPQAPPEPEPEPEPEPGPDPAPSSVAGRWVFYNNSAFDGNDPVADARDDAAIASDKQALLPGQGAGFSNYTSYAKGINGVMVDVAGLPQGATLTAEDFVIRAGTNAPTRWDDLSPGGWALAPAPSSVTVRRGAGVNGSDRVTLVWPDGQIQKQWLQITVLPTANTDLAAPDTFYFGNAIGETGNHPRNAIVNKVDAKRAWRNRPRGRGPVTPVDVTSAYDFDRDGVITATDRLLARQHRTTKRTALLLITGA